RFGFVLDGEAVNGRMKVRDLEKLIWDGEIAGGVDLEKIMTIFPIEGTSIAGRIEADVASKGSYAAVAAGKYSQLETRGTMDVSNFNYSSVDVPQGVQITKAKAEFTPERINLSEFNSKIGQSPV